SRPTAQRQADRPEIGSGLFRGRQRGEFTGHRKRMHESGERPSASALTDHRADERGWCATFYTRRSPAKTNRAPKPVRDRQGLSGVAALESSSAPEFLRNSY